MTITTRSRARTLATSALVAALGLSGVGLAASADAAKRPSKTPNTLALAGALAKQKPTWGACEFSRELKWEDREELEAWKNLECANITVPMDWHNPKNGKTLSIRVSRVTNLPQSSRDYKGTVLLNPGGPGAEALHWGPGVMRRIPELAKNFNSIGIDPRGIGQSEQPACGIPLGTPTEGKEWAKVVGETCSKIEAVTKINTEQTAYDFDFVRGLLGIKKITYLGYSYGTWLGTWYGSIFGANIDKMVLDSAIDGTAKTLEPGWDLQPIARDRQFKDVMLPYAGRVFERLKATATPYQIEYYFPTTAKEVSEFYWASFNRTYEADGGPQAVFWYWALTGGLAGFPDPSAYPMSANTIGIFVQDEVVRRIESGEIPTPIESEDAAKQAATGTALITKIREGADPATLASAAKAAVVTNLSPADKTRLGQYADLVTSTAREAAADVELKQGFDPFDAVRCGDGQWTQGEAYWDKWLTDTTTKAPFTKVLAEHIYPACAFWETDNATKPAPDRKSFPETLVIQGEEDSQTGYEGGYRTGTKLPNTSFIAVDNATRHGYFPYRTACVDNPTFEFLLEGDLFQKTRVCQGKPLPDDSKTYEAWSPINVNGKHVKNGEIPSRVLDPETGVAGPSISSELAQAELTRLVKNAVATQGR